MKRLFLMMCLAGGGWFGWNSMAPSVDDLPEATAATGVREAETTLAEVAAAGATFADLARPGVYTLVVVSSDRCPPCRTLEKRMPALLKARPDVVVMTVNLPSGSFTAASESEAREMIASMQIQSEKFNVGSTPHVEIFGPTGEAVARDDGSSKTGYELLQEWIAAES